MNLKIKKVDLICLYFFLHPLAYTNDGDEFRNIKLVIFSLVSIILFWREIPLIKLRNEKLFYSLFFFLLIAQQFFIGNGNFIFGIKFCIAFLLFTFPFWLFEKFSNKVKNFDLIIEKGIDILFFICLINYLLSFFIGFGELYPSGGLLGRRAFGLLGDSYIPMLSFLQIYYFIKNKKIFFYFSIIFLLITGGKIGILLTSFIFLLDGLIKRKLNKNIFLLFVILIPFLIYLLFYFGVNLNLDYSYNNRLISYLFAFDYFKESPLFGIGINGGLSRLISESNEFIYIFNIDNTYNIYQVHNTILRVLSETGIAGIIALIGIYFNLFNNSIKVLTKVRKLDVRNYALYYSSAIWLISFLIIYQGTAWLLPGHPIFGFLLFSSSLNNIYLNKKEI